MIPYKLVASLAVSEEQAKALANRMIAGKEYPVLDVSQTLDSLLIIGELGSPVLMGCHLIKVRIVGEGNGCKCNDNGIIAVSGEPVGELPTNDAARTGTTYPISRAKRK